jgi:hypothetical protein
MIFFQLFNLQSLTENINKSTQIHPRKLLGGIILISPVSLVQVMVVGEFEMEQTDVVKKTKKTVDCFTNSGISRL